MNSAKKKIYISKEQNHTVQQAYVKECVKRTQMSLKRAICNILLVSPISLILGLGLFGFQHYYRYECVEEGIKIDKYEYTQKVETYLCPNASLRSLLGEWSSFGRGPGSLIVQYKVNNQTMTLFETTAWGFLNGRVNRYINEIGQLTQQGQTLWIFPYIGTWWFLIPFLLFTNFVIGCAYINLNVELKIDDNVKGFSAKLLRFIKSGQIGQNGRSTH